VDWRKTASSLTEEPINENACFSLAAPPGYATLRDCKIDRATRGLDRVRGQAICYAYYACPRIIRARLRICHTTNETIAHTRLAALSTMPAECASKNCQTIPANVSRQRLPMAEPAASTLAACLPLTVPFYAVFFCCFSCFSIRVALAEKIAGKASKSPAITGP
jgi:hypothetical protein